jgi:hydroxymethylpyrimidine/phosphomethylpyrimidine kinase
MPLRPRSRNLPVALSVAGSDSGAGAGVQADLLTFAALGVFGTTAITCLTAQNPENVSGVHEVPAAFVREQMQQVADFFPLRAMKTGMLFSAPIIRAVAAFLREHPRLRVVVDPVMVATSGAVLLRPDAIDAMKRALFPRASLVTPNLDEAGVLLGRKLATAADAIEAARALAERFDVPFLVKGGHLAGDAIVDVLARPGAAPRVFRARRIRGVDTHGSGCTLSAAIAALLARGESLEDAVGGGRLYLRRGIARSLTVARKNFIAHGGPRPARRG